MRKPNRQSGGTSAAWPVAAALAVAIVVTACGGGGGGGGTADTTAPTATLSQAGIDLEKTAPLVVRFSESMNPTSLRISGSLAGEGTGAWSKTSAENDTYTLSPPAAGWSRGGHDLKLDAADTAGNALATVNATYVVKLVFETFQGASVVIGQANFAGSSANQGLALPAPNTLQRLYGNPAVAPDGKLFISDTLNNRVLAFNAVPTVNNASAAFVLGQVDFKSDEWKVEAGTHPGPEFAAIGNGKLIVTSYDANRVVIYNSIPTDGSATQSVVVGQSNFTDSDGACTKSGLLGPQAGIATPDGKLIVTDSDNHRVLIWNSMPTTHGQEADVVLGQTDFTHCIANDANRDGTVDDNPNDRTLMFPAGVWSDGKRLVVIDRGNSRVLIWNQMPTSNFQQADVVLGQSAFTKAAPDDENGDGVPDLTPSAQTLDFPYLGVTSNGVQLAVADTGNHRVLIWNSFPTRNAQPADVVLGQGAFNRGVPNDHDQNGQQDTTASAHVLRSPRGLLFHRDQLFVVDSSNSRVLVFQSR